MNADLKNSLETAHKTVATVKNQLQADKCIAEGTDYWISNHLQIAWCIVSIDLTLFTTVTSAITPKLVTNEQLGIYQPPLLKGKNFKYTLFVYSSDKYTEDWVHKLIISQALHPTNRILNVQRDDEGSIIDLGDLTFGKSS